MTSTTVPELSILVIGDGGTGKTRFIEQLPKPHVCDFDKGSSSIRDKVIRDSVMIFKDAPRGSKVIMPAKGIYEWGTGWTKFIEKINDIGKAIDEGTYPYETICLDSLTFMSELCMNNILKNSGHKGMELQDWGAFLRAMGSFMDQFTSWPLLKYLTAHVQRSENPVTEGGKEMLPLISGQMQGKIHLFFDEVWYTEVLSERKGSEITNTHVFRTHSNSVMKQARTRKEVPDKIEQDWKKILPFLVK